MNASAPRLRRGLYLVLTDPPAGYERMAEWAMDAGLPAIQFRPKRIPSRIATDREWLRVARALRAITRGSSTLFIVNDRPDLAILSEADGIHVGQEDLPPGEVRRLIGNQRLLGLSTHNLDQVRAANAEPVDYIGFGPLFETNSKDHPDPVTGPDLLAQAAALSRHPIVAIGGLTAERVATLPCAHYRCAAVIRAVAEATDPALAMKTLQRQIQENEWI
ncbi:MAG TPA: thiamine phosphate synthase [Verrucomicrobia bacterium]|nr:thiamine phosphate synthase [Verrucomicrobiota bacterium]